MHLIFTVFILFPGKFAPEYGTVNYGKGDNFKLYYYILALHLTPLP
jgi:hypothetical protein